MIGEAEIVALRMHHQTSTDNAVFAKQRHDIIDLVDSGERVGHFRLNVAQIADVSHRSVRRAMIATRRIEMFAGRSASVTHIAKFVHVKAVQSFRQVHNVAGDVY